MVGKDCVGISCDKRKTNTEEKITSQNEETECKPAVAARAVAITGDEEKEHTEEVKPIDSSTEKESNLKSIETLDLDSDEPKIINDTKDDKDDAGLQVANIGSEQENEEDDDVSQIWKCCLFYLILTFFF